MSKMSREFKFQMKARQVPRKYRTLREWRRVKRYLGRQEKAYAKYIRKFWDTAI